MAGWIKMPLGIEVGLIPGEFLLDEDTAQTPKKGRAPQFTADVYYGQTAGWMEMTLGMEVGLGPGHIVLDIDQGHLPHKWQSVSQFSAHVYCGQTAGWIKMPLGTETGFGPGDIVLDGDPALHPTNPQKGAQPPIFGPCLLWPNGFMHQDTSWY